MTVLFRKSTLILLLSGFVGGYIGSCSGVSIGWLIGAFSFSMLLSLWSPTWSDLGIKKPAMSTPFRKAGQFILGIQLGQQVTFAILDTIEDNAYMIVSVFIFSISLALLSGWVLKRYSNTNLITSLFATTPGGTTAMASIADEAGANIMIVSVIQLMRMLCVIAVIPVILHFVHPAKLNIPHPEVSTLSYTSIFFTLSLVSFAWFGGKIGKYLRLPAPWLFGSMLFVAFIVSLSSLFHFLVPIWFPFWLPILAQILIGISIGSKIRKNMFHGVRKPAMIGTMLSFCFVIIMCFSSVILSNITGIPLTTSLLAFAPGGVAEMATTSLAVHADVTFVVAVQLMRLVVSLFLLPLLFRLIERHSTELNSPTKRLKQDTPHL